MSSEKKIIEAANAAIASLTNDLFHTTMKAVALLCNSNMSKSEMVEAMPSLARSVAKGIEAQQAADAVIAEFNAKHKP